MNLKFGNATLNVGTAWSRKTPLHGRPWFLWMLSFSVPKWSLHVSFDTEIDRSVRFSEYWGTHEIYGKSSDFTPIGLRYHKGFDRDDREVNEGVPVERGKFGRPFKMVSLLLYPLKADFCWINKPIAYTEENVKKYGAA